MFVKNDCLFFRIDLLIYNINQVGQLNSLGFLGVSYFKNMFTKQFIHYLNGKTNVTKFTSMNLLGDKRNVLIRNISLSELSSIAHNSINHCLEYQFNLFVSIRLKGQEIEFKIRSLLGLNTTEEV